MSVMKKSQLDAGFEPEAEQELLSEINITPLTDVFLVLLIIFMVTSSALSQLGVDVELPKTSQGNGSALEPQAVILTISQTQSPSQSLSQSPFQSKSGSADLGSDSGTQPRVRVWINGTPLAPAMSSADLITALKEALEKVPSKTVIIEGDQSIRLGETMRWIDLAQSAGAKHFSIAASAALPQ
jgi:biopolymer transport protein TolR